MFLLMACNLHGRSETLFDWMGPWYHTVSCSLVFFQTLHASQELSAACAITFIFCPKVPSKKRILWSFLLVATMQKLSRLDCPRQTRISHKNSRRDNILLTVRSQTKKIRNQTEFPLKNLGERISIEIEEPFLH